MVIEVAGHVVARLRAGQNTDLPVTAGRRLVRAHADWLSSPTVEVEVREGSTVGVRVGCAEDVASLESLLVHPEAAITITVGGASAAGAFPSRDQAANMRRAEYDQDMDGPFRRSGS